MSFSIIILAAGKGKRMNSKVPKVFHKVGNHPMIYHVLDIGMSLKPKFVSLVISEGLDIYKSEIKKKYKKVLFAKQHKQLGTADAVSTALKEKSLRNSNLSLILYGDTPLITKKTLEDSIRKFKKKKADLCVLSMTPSHTNHSYGRLVTKKSRLIKIIEKSEFKSSYDLDNLCNTGIMLIKTNFLTDALKKIRNNNSKKEFFLTDIVEVFNKQKMNVIHVEFPYEEFLGVNDKNDLATVEKVFQNRMREKFLKQGVTLTDPSTVFFSADTEIGNDVIIHPNVQFGRKVKLGNRVEIKGFCHIENSSLNDDVSVGPFARLRDESEIDKDSKIGNFVEIKKSKIKKNVKISHLSYVGDAEINNNANIGAGMITCNYDGYKKNKTYIGENCFIGSNSSLIAPIKIEKNSIIGASTVIDKDIPAGTTVYRKSELIKKNNKK